MAKKIAERIASRGFQRGIEASKGEMAENNIRVFPERVSRERERVSKESIERECVCVSRERGRTGANSSTRVTYSTSRSMALILASDT